MTMKNSRPSTIIMTTSITISERCVLRVNTKTPKNTQPREMQSVTSVLSSITSGTAKDSRLSALTEAAAPPPRRPAALPPAFSASAMVQTREA